MNLEDKIITVTDNIYQIIANAKDSENGKTMVVYKNLKVPNQYWITSLDQFPKTLEHIDHNKHPNKNYDSLMGKYRHFKNKEYETICVAINTETDEEMMVYRALYGNFDIWARPLSMFLGYKEQDGKLIKRFQKIE